ncbi:HD domain-containing protein [bacterium]|nr:MAG: HD domain-containing protein [bacterium]
MILNVTRTISQLISAIAFALDIDEGQKLYHAWRVSIFGAELAKMMLAEERKDVFYACLLHDIGGIGFSDHIIHYLLKEEIPKDPAVLAHSLTGAEIVIHNN